MRLGPDTLADLDLIAQWLRESTGTAATRTDAVRYAGRQVAQQITQKTSKKKPG